jgi:hypothetical protein
VLIALRVERSEHVGVAFHGVSGSFFVIFVFFMMGLILLTVLSFVAGL